MTDAVTHLRRPKDGNPPWTTFSAATAAKLAGNTARPVGTRATFSSGDAMSTTAINIDSTVNQAGHSHWRNTVKQGHQDFDQLFQSIQSGNIAGAQQAYAALDALRSGAPPAGDATASSRPASMATGEGNAIAGISSDWATLGQALKSESLDSAKGALSALEQDAATITKSRHELERQNAESIYALISSVQASAINGAPNIPTTGQAPAVQDDLNGLGNALKTGDPVSAEKLLAKLEQDLLASARTQTQEHHRHQRVSGNQESGLPIMSGAGSSAMRTFMGSAIHA
ncbi:MAG TPA: hypothetical protein VIO81_03050 [Methyloversatilis sp.]